MKYRMKIVKGANVAAQNHDMIMEKPIEIFASEFTSEDLLDAVRFTNTLFICWRENREALGESEAGMSYMPLGPFEIHEPSILN